MTAVPPPYDRQASFTGFSTEQAPTVGQNLEAEFNKLKQVSDATQSRLAEIQRDDGKLANQSVHPDALSSGVRVLLAAAGGEIRGAWGAGAVYQQKDLVVAPDDAAYLAVVEHLSGADFDVDLAAGKWIPIDTASAIDQEIRNDVQSGELEGPLRGELASNAPGDGGDMLSAARYGVGPYYLHNMSQIAQGADVPALIAIPSAEHAAILAGTSTYDATSALNTMIADMMAGRGGTVLLPHGKLFANILISQAGLADDSKLTRVNLRGHGSKISEVASPGASGAVVSIVGKWPIYTSTMVSGVRLRGQLGTTRGLKAQNGVGLTLIDVICTEANVGLELIDCLAVDLIKSSTIFNTYGAQFSRLSNTYPNLINMLGGSIGGNLVYGLLSTGGCGFNPRGVGVEGNGSSLPAADPTGWGMKFVDSGVEGGVAAAISGCYFEANNGQADIWFTESTQMATARVGGTTFNRNSNVKYTTNNILVETSGTGRFYGDFLGNSSFVAAGGTYVRNSSRRTVIGTGVSGSIHFDVSGIGLETSQVDAPFLSQAGRLGHMEAMTQSWVRFAGATGSVLSQYGTASVTRNSAGNYTIVLNHDVPKAKEHIINIEHSAATCWQLVSETGTSVNFTVKDATGASFVDPVRIYYEVKG